VRELLKYYTTYKRNYQYKSFDGFLDWLDAANSELSNIIKEAK